MKPVVTENQLKTIISRNLKRLMKDRGMSQGDVARALWPKDMEGTKSMQTSKRNTVSRWVRAGRTPSASECLNLAEVFGCPVEELTAKKTRKKVSAA